MHLARRSDRRPLAVLRTALRTTAFGASLAVALAATLALGATVPGQMANALYLPDLQADVKSSPVPGVGVRGQEGFGNAVVDVQNLADAANAIDLALWPKSGTDPAAFQRNLGPRQATRFDLQAEAGATGGFYAGKLAGSQALGGAARVRWVSGAAVAYEAQPGVKDLILPLIVRSVYSHTSILFAQNTDQANRNKIEMTLYNAENGNIMIEALANTEPGETYGWDTAYTENTFGPSAVGSNAPTGGWLGHAWFRAEKPIAVLAYGDEMAAQGSSAYVARPVAAAATVQYLPLVRANYYGESLIAIANAGNKAVDVTIDYRGAPFSPSAANQSSGQQLQIGPRGAVFIDLSTRQRGTRPAPTLPRGSGANRGFVGSATITASGPVLAVAQDEQLKGTVVDSVSAYNAFGPNDLGTQFSAVSVRKLVDYQTTVLCLQNPGSAAVDVTVDLFGANEAAAGQLTAQVPAGSVARLSLGDAPTFPKGLGRAVLRATGPVAALVYDGRDTSEDPTGASHTITIGDVYDSGVSGTAQLTEKGSDLEVVIALRGIAAGTKHEAAIRKGECPYAWEVAYPLATVEGGKSTTTLRNLNIKALTATPHAVVVQGPPPWPGQPGQTVACGLIVEIHGADFADTAVAWPVRLVAGGSNVTPTVPPPTATATAAPATVTRAASATRPATTVTPTVMPSVTPEATRYFAHLPLAYKR